CNQMSCAAVMEDNYAVHNIVTDGAYEAFNAVSFCHANTLIADNLVDGVANYGVEWGSTGALIVNNVFHDVGWSAIAVEGGAAEATGAAGIGWLRISGNVVNN